MLFTTSDITLAAALVVSGIELVKTKKIENKIYFSFEDNDLLENTKMDFINGKLMVPAKEFHNTIKLLKNI